MYVTGMQTIAVTTDGFGSMKNIHHKKIIVVYFREAVPIANTEAIITQEMTNDCESIDRAIPVNTTSTSIIKYASAPVLRL